MGMEAMVATVLMATQFIKDILKDWGLNVVKGWAVLLSFLVSIGVVLFTYLKAGTPITLETVWVLVSVFALANGGKKLLGKLRPK